VKKMDCEGIRRLISKVIDDEASADEQAELEGHCSDCSGCRSEREVQFAIHEALTGAADELLDALRPREVTRTAPGPTARRSSWRTVLRAASVAALMLLSGATGYVLPRAGEPPENRRPLPEARAGNQLGVTTPAQAEPARPDRPAADHPVVMVAELEGQPIREVVWDDERGVRESSVVHRGRLHRVATPDGRLALEWLTTDSQYRLVGFPHD
jgi:anti-sigma factor RsiW